MCLHKAHSEFNTAVLNKYNIIYNNKAYFCGMVNGVYLQYIFLFYVFEQHMYKENMQAIHRNIPVGIRTRAFSLHVLTTLPPCIPKIWTPQTKLW